MWRRSLAAAVQLEMTYEQALAHYEIGRHLATDEAKCTEHLERAIDIFSRLDTMPALRRAQAALDS